MEYNFATKIAFWINMTVLVFFSLFSIVPEGRDEVDMIFLSMLLYYFVAPVLFIFLIISAWDGMRSKDIHCIIPIFFLSALFFGPLVKFVSDGWGDNVWQYAAFTGLYILAFIILSLTEKYKNDILLCRKELFLLMAIASFAGLIAAGGWLLDVLQGDMGIGYLIFVLLFTALAWHAKATRSTRITNNPNSL